MEEIWRILIEFQRNPEDFKGISMAGEDFPMAGEDFPMAGEDFGQPASPQPIEIHWIFLIFLDFASNPTA